MVKILYMLYHCRICLCRLTSCVVFDPLWNVHLYYVPCSLCRWLFTTNSLLLVLCHHCRYCCQSCLHHNHHHLPHIQPHLHQLVHSLLYLHYIQLPHNSNCFLGIWAHTTRPVSASSKVCSCLCFVLHTDAGQHLCRIFFCLDNMLVHQLQHWHTCMKKLHLDFCKVPTYSGCTGQGPQIGVSSYILTSFFWQKRPQVQVHASVNDCD